MLLKAGTNTAERTEASEQQQESFKSTMTYETIRYWDTATAELETAACVSSIKIVGVQRDINH